MSLGRQLTAEGIGTALLLMVREIDR